LNLFWIYYESMDHVTSRRHILTVSKRKETDEFLKSVEPFIFEKKRISIILTIHLFLTFFSFSFHSLNFVYISSLNYLKSFFFWLGSANICSYFLTNFILNLIFRWTKNVRCANLLFAIGCRNVFICSHKRKCFTLL